MITAEQVAELAANLAQARHDGHMPTDLEGMQRQIERIEAAKHALAKTAPDMAFLIAQQAAEIEGLRKDAARYRWLTDGKRGDWVWNHVLTEEVKAGHRDIDPAIDAAIKQKE